ncbi:MAG: NfeD family protein [Marinicaulis sp.]|nr:NfeD family protein [Marinicaulis sp.]
MEAIIEFFSTMPFWYWLVAATILLVIEIVTGSTYFLWPAIAAAVTSVAALFGFVPWQAELFLFATSTIALSVIAPPYVKPWLHRTQADHPNLNQRGAQKIGRRATVDVTFTNGVGKVRLGDTLWLAESENGEDFEEGEKVVVAKAEGTKLIVKAA